MDTGEECRACTRTREDRLPAWLAAPAASTAQQAEEPTATEPPTLSVVQGTRQGVRQATASQDRPLFPAVVDDDPLTAEERLSAEEARALLRRAVVEGAHGGRPQRRRHRAG